MGAYKLSSLSNHETILELVRDMKHNFKFDQLIQASLEKKQLTQSQSNFLKSAVKVLMAPFEGLLYYILQCTIIVVIIVALFKILYTYRKKLFYCQSPEFSPRIRELMLKSKYFSKFLKQVKIEEENNDIELEDIQPDSNSPLLDVKKTFATLLNAPEKPPRRVNPLEFELSERKDEKPILVVHEGVQHQPHSIEVNPSAPLDPPSPYYADFELLNERGQLYPSIPIARSRCNSCSRRSSGRSNKAGYKVRRQM